MRGLLFAFALATLAGCASGRALQPPPSPYAISSGPSRLSGEPGGAVVTGRTAAQAGVEAAKGETIAESEEVQPAGAEVARSRAKPKAKGPSRRGRIIVGRASSLVGVKTLRRISRRVPDDCTGLPRLAYEKAGIDLLEDVQGRPGENGVTAIYRRARAAGALHKRKPKPGDLVFFRETYDRNRDGRRNDGLTHIGVVESVGRDGTVVFVHRASKGVVRAKLNRRHPLKRTVKGEVVNDYLRRADRRHRAYLTGELFASFASPDRF